MAARAVTSGVVTAKIHIGDGGQVADLQLSSDNHYLAGEVHVAIELSKFAARCSGRVLELVFSFTLEDPPTDGIIPPAVRFLPPNRFELIFRRVRPNHQAPPPPESISVCQLLVAPMAADGKQVNVRGVYHANSEGARVVDPICNERSKHKDQNWSGAVWLDSLPAGTDALDLMVASLSDKSSVVWATFNGRIEYCPKQVRMGGRVQWLGCGNVGDFILQLSVDAVTDVEVKPGNDIGLPPPLAK